MLLKFKKSEPWSWPVLTAEAIGRLMVKLLVEVEMLKIEPEVPVAMFWLRTTLLPKEMLVEVPIKTC